MGKFIDEFDIVLGKNLKRMRKYKKCSMQDVSCLFNVTPQQICKYEQGRNRISASNLYKLSKYYNVDMRIFFSKIDMETYFDKRKGKIK